MDELGELHNLKVNKLVQVSYTDVVQSRAINIGDEVLKILASALEFKTDECRKNYPCNWGRRADSMKAGSSK